MKICDCSAVNAAFGPVKERLLLSFAGSILRELTIWHFENFSIYLHETNSLVSDSIILVQLNRDI